MRRHYQILLPLLGLFLCRVDLTDLFPLKIQVKLLKIYDGDTVLVSHGHSRYKVRIAKIDSPEKGQPFLTQSGDAGMVSKKCLEKILADESVLYLKPEHNDIYGRILGDINDVSFKMIVRGCTTLYPHARFDSISEKMKYLDALKKAKASRRGLWKYGGFRQPKIFRKRVSHRQSHR